MKQTTPTYIDYFFSKRPSHDHSKNKNPSWSHFMSSFARERGGGHLAWSLYNIARIIMCKSHWFYFNLKEITATKFTNMCIFVGHLKFMYIYNDIPCSSCPSNFIIRRISLVAPTCIFQLYDFWIFWNWDETKIILFTNLITELVFT